MKDIITSRRELLLAKVAGRDVDISTMTPPVAASMEEKLMLEIAERISESSLPPVTASDEGKVLSVDDSGEWTAAEAADALPAVTAEDNGKVLGVVDGGWDAMAPSDKTFVFDLDGNYSNANVTYQDIIDAVNADKTVVARLIYTNSSYTQTYLYELRYLNVYPANTASNQVVLIGFSSGPLYYDRLEARGFTPSNTVAFSLKQVEFVNQITLTETQDGTLDNSYVYVGDVFRTDYFVTQTGTFFAPMTNTYYEIISFMEDLGTSRRNITIKNKVTGAIYSTGDVALTSRLSFSEVTTNP